MPAFSVSIEQVADLLGLERKPSDRRGAVSQNFRCPFCDDAGNKYHLNINTQKNTYFCVRCMDRTWRNTGALDLYARVRHGVRCVPGQNSKNLFIEMKTELEGGSSQYVYDNTKAEEYREILPASDEELSAAYEGLIALPSVELSDSHLKNLRDRGLSYEAIRKNGYATVLPSKEFIEFRDCSEAAAMYRVCGMEQFRKNSDILKRYSRQDIIAGLYTAGELVKQGINLERVPGFFRICGKWCMRWDAGILIPTRNITGQIVGIQTRRDVSLKDGTRYLTLSSKGLPDGPTANISRTHFPLANSGINASTKVYLTEGPLKSDVAVHLMSELGCGSVAFIAVQGVNSTREISDSIARMTRERGVSVWYNAFDMDKLLNVHVGNACKCISGLLEKEGIRFVPLMWDKKYAVAKRTQMKQICENNGVEWELTGNIYGDLVQMSRALKAADIPYCYVTDRNGEPVEENWRSSQKGIDDHLLSLTKKH